MLGRRERGVGCGVMAALCVLVCGVTEAAPPARGSAGGCRAAVLEGEVGAGRGLRHAMLAGPGGVDAVLDPLPSGWVLRVEPSSGGYAGDDFAEMATPPYRSVSPLLLSTDFAFRAQDAVGWNPRRFRYAADAESFERMRRLRRAAEAGGMTGRKEEMELAQMASQQPGGTMTILDAHLVPGTADQTRSAAMVAGHFLSTAHTLEQPGGGRATGLGQLTWMRVRVSLALLPKSRPAEGVRVESVACAAF